MIIVTGAAGFIGSCLVQKLNDEGYEDLVLVDDFSREDQNRNFKGKKFSKTIERDDFIVWLKENQRDVQFVFHMGARTDTTESDQDLLNKLNLNYSKEIWQVCVAFGLPLVYASSAATYGSGEQGYDDDEEKISQLKPLNLYGHSKNEFDKWVLSAEKKPYFWAGMKFFNVYGPNEYHKGRMASVILHTYHKIKETGGMELFQSHRAEVKDGEQMRDFVYVKDVVNVLYFLMLNRKKPGIYNLGSGKARTFYDLAANTFRAMGKIPQITFIPTPEDIRDKYQYFTEANMTKLEAAGYHQPFYTLEAGIDDYVKNYLANDKYN